jgi:hypothetical protein
MTHKYIDFVSGEDAREIAENVAEVLKMLAESKHTSRTSGLDIIKQLTGEHYESFLKEIGAV